MGKYETTVKKEDVLNEVLIGDIAHDELIKELESRGIPVKEIKAYASSGSYTGSLERKLVRIYGEAIEPVPSAFCIVTAGREKDVRDLYREIISDPEYRKAHEPSFSFREIQEGEGGEYRTAPSASRSSSGDRDIDWDAWYEKLKKNGTVIKERSPKSN